MPDFDPTSRFAHLIQLCVEYQELIDEIESRRFDTDDINYLTGQRGVLHDQIIAEMERLGMAVADREETMRQALRIARWLGPEE